MESATLTHAVRLDSVTFGVPESERLHPARGCLAEPHDAPQCRYGGPAHVVADAGPVAHWRDWAGRIAVELVVPAWADGRALRWTATLRAFAVDGPAEPPRPTRFAVAGDAGPLAEFAATLPPNGTWTVLECEFAARAGALWFEIDDGGNVFAGGAHYGKSIADVVLAALDDGEAPRAGVRRRVLVDALDFGLPESEATRDVFGNFALRIKGPRNLYGGPPNVLPNRDAAHFREAPRASGFALRVPPAWAGADLEVEVALRAYRVGEPAIDPRPTVVLGGNTLPARLGAVTVPLDQRFHAVRYRVPARVVGDGTCQAWVDDTAGHVDLDRHYGKAFATIRLLADPDRPRPPLAPGPPAPPPDVLLVMAPVWDVLMPPVSLGTLAAVLEKRGLRVACFDFNIECYHAVGADEKTMWEGSNAVRWAEWDYAQSMVERLDAQVGAAVERILASDAPVVGFSVATVNAAFTLRLAQRLKERRPGLTVVYGGPGLPFFPQEQLGPHWDYLVYGAGEHAMAALVRGGDATGPGVVSRDRLAPYDPRTNRARLADLDEMPLAHYSHFDLSRYVHPWRLPVVTSRGCINACRYCFDTVFYGPYACLSGDRAFEQIRLLHDLHGRRVFEFSDLLCNGNLRELERMCDRLIEADLGVEWGSFAVIRPGMASGLMAKLKASGCAYLHYGFETGSAEMLARMGRNYAVEDAAETLAHTKAAGIRTIINIMVGFPGETDATIAETIGFLAAHGEAVDLVDTVNPVYLMASTDLDRNREKYGIAMPDGIPDHWASPDVDEARRREWVYRVMDAVRAAGIPCNYSVLRDFVCRKSE